MLALSSMCSGLVISDGGNFTSTLTDLAFNTTYYVRAYATNSMGRNIPLVTLYNWYAVNTGKLCPPGWHVRCLKD